MFLRNVRVLVCWSRFSRPDTHSIVCNCMLEGHGMLPSRRRQLSSASNDGEQQKDEPQGYRVLFPRAIPNPKGREEEENLRLPRSIAGWRSVFSNTWRDYLITWEGFFESKQDESKENETKEEETAMSEMKGIIEGQTKAVRGNVKRNVAFVKKEGPKFLQFIKDETRIYTKEDLKEWAGEQLKLATQCVNEFMAGYRSGRDEEVDKMLNEYFKEEGEEKEADAPKRNRRKPKRLIRRA